MGKIDFKNNYVNHNLLRGWSEDGRVVDWYNPVDKEGLKETEIDDLYYFNFHSIESYVAAVVSNHDGYFEETLREISSGDNPFESNSFNMKARTSFMFQYLRTPSFFKEDYARCSGAKTLNFLNRYKGRSYFTVVEKDFEVLKDYLGTMGQFTLTATLETMDLEGIILSAAEGTSFVVGAVPVIMMNPYFEKRYASTKMEDKPYDIIGAVMVLPVSPETAVMLYDKNTYDVAAEDGKAMLSKEDVDLLNIAEIYNSDIDGGVVYSGVGKGYLDSLKERIFDTPFRSGYAWFTSSRYPVSMLLSIMTIKQSAEKEMQKNAKKPLREYVVKIREHEKKQEYKHYMNHGQRMLDRMNYASALLGTDHKFEEVEVRNV